MFQIIFNELSAAEISALPKKLQLELLAQFQILPEDLDQLDSERFGVIEREGKKLYRYRAKDYRIYFAKTDEGIKVHRVLHKNTFRDFLFRSKLPVSEDAQLGETREFLGVLFERAKVFETGAHDTPSGVRFRVNPAVALRYGMRGVGREIIPEMLEVNALAAMHQRERRLSIEMKMPKIAH